MAIKPLTAYPTQVDGTDLTNYPQGKAQNETVPGDGLGTPWEKDLLNDIFGFQQKLLNFADITPSGTPDNIVTSQYFEALAVLSNRGTIGRSWDLVDDPADSSWEGIAYSQTLKRFVVVADSGTGVSDIIKYSDDGVNWTLATAPNTNQWRAVVWGLDKFVAVSDSGTGNRVMTSLDGIVWTAQVSSVDSDFEAIAYSSDLDLYVAVASTGPGTNDQIMTSPDGIAWTTQNNVIDESWGSVIWGDGIFVVAALSFATNDILTSVDGVTWIPRTTGLAAGAAWRSIAYSPKLDLFAVVGSNKYYSSSDGITWALGSPANSNDWRSIIWYDQMFIKISEYSVGVPGVAVSYDGVKWGQHNAALNITTNWEDLIYGNGILVAIGSVGVNRKTMISGKPFIKYRGL